MLLWVRANKDRRILYDADALECHAKEKLSSFDLSVQGYADCLYLYRIAFSFFPATTSFTLTMIGFFSLLFTFVSFSCYLYLRKLDSSINCRLTASSSDRRRRRKIVVNLPFHCDRLLFVSFLVAIVFASSTDAIDSAFQESCVGQYYVLFLFLQCVIAVSFDTFSSYARSFYSCTLVS